MKAFIKFLLPFVALIMMINASEAQDSWTKKANFPGVGRCYAAGFSIGNRGYVGGGDTSNNFNTGLPLKNDFWQYNPDSNKWSQKANIPGYPRFGGVYFSIGNKGFFGGGNGGNDFWEYDPAQNTWTRKADIPGYVRLYPAAFAIGGKGYVGMGFIWGAGSLIVLHDFWEYDTIYNSWTQKSNFAGVPKCYAVGFAIGNKGFIGTGLDSNNSYYNDFWEYNPAKDSWTQKASIGLNGRSGAIGFSMANEGYIGFGYINQTGVENDMWAYDTTNNKWTQKSYSDPAYVVSSPVAFRIRNTAYVGSGEDYNGNFYNDFYKYSNHTAGIAEPNNQINFSIYPNPNTGNFVLSTSYQIQSYTICDMNGKEIYRNGVNEPGSQINIDLNLSKGMFLIKVVSSEGTAVKKFLVED